MKTRLLVGLCSLFVALSLCTTSAYAAEINPEKHSKDEVQKYVLNAEKNFDVKTSYVETPSAKVPYKTGKVSNESLNAALEIMNMYRYIAGISPVELDEQYNVYAQAGAVLNEAVGRMDHTPEQPADMPDDFYKLGYKGTSSSNLSSGGSSYGFLTIAEGLKGWISDNNNVSPGVGHRIWTLDPNMKKVGFGITEHYRVMYAFDSADTGLGWNSPNKYKNLIWPAAETPLDYFENAKYWSIRTGDSEAQNKISISVTNKSTQTTYTVNNADIMVQSGCAFSDVIVFKSPITAPEDDTTYTVSISGLTQGNLSYDVHFFEIHKMKKCYEQVDSTCSSYGLKKYYECACGDRYVLGYFGKREIIKDFDAWKDGAGRIEKKNHDFSKQPYQVDEDGKHYQKCKDCGAESTHEAHTGGTATCKVKAKCTVCGEEYGSLAAHTYATKWSTDATNHWHACTVCGAKKDNAAHTDSDKNEKCDTCDYNMHSHSGTKVAQVDATCTAYGVKEYYKCSCGKYYTDSACTKEITDLAAWKSGDGRIEKKEHTLKTTMTKATLTANGKQETKCTVCGKITKTETIYAAKTIKLSATKYTYDGKAKKPTVTIQDSQGNAIASSDYTVTYPSGRKNVGKYTVKVTFKGNYSGSKNLTFTINPPKTSISKLTVGKKAFTAKWAKKTTQVTGYEIQYSTSKTFASGNKTVKVTSAKTVSKSIKSLKAKKTYYVRIRTYKTVNKVKYYSDWSAKKSVTTKK